MMFSDAIQLYGLALLAFAPATIALLLSALPWLMTLINMPLFFDWRFDPDSEVEIPSVSVLIPARDEANGIEVCVRSVLQSANCELEVIVLDDGSTDETAAIVRKIMADDSRVRLMDGGTLPNDWNGKQYACHRMADEARHDRMLFLDADVRLQPNAIEELCRRKNDGLFDRPIALLSAFPRQETGTLLEKMLIPMMHWILLGYLPFSRMRASTSPAYAAGCGQLFLTDRENYQRAGTHQAIASSRHDGLKLPRAYREQGLLTDCVDASQLASCRMYTSAGQVTRGLLKNAHEGIANRRLLPLFTVLLGGAALLPWLSLALAAWLFQSHDLPTLVRFPAFIGVITSLTAIVVSYLPRWFNAYRLNQSYLGVALHPIAVLVFLVIQWWAFLNHLAGKQVAWRGRLE